MQRHYHHLVSNTNKKRIEEILEELLEKNKKFSLQIDKLSKSLNETMSHSKLALRKVGLVSYNPFERMGGEQSFAIALLDSDENGIILTSMHSKDGTRVYAKNIKKGESSQQLSQEEEKALQQAKQKI